MLNASFIGFTGMPLYLTPRVFGGYASRYHLKRSEEDQYTVKLIYEGCCEKLAIGRLDHTDHIAVKIEQAERDQDQLALIGKPLGQDYGVIITDDRMDAPADDSMEYSSIRKELGKSMLVFIVRVNSTQMSKCIEPQWSKSRQNCKYTSAE